MNINADLKVLDDITHEQKVINKPVENMTDLFNKLSNLGNDWRIEHTTENKKTGEIKVPRVPARTVANILKKNASFIIVTDDNPEIAPLCVYDMDEGIYKRGSRFIGKLILAVEPTINQAGRMNIIGWLEIECKEQEPTRLAHLVVMNNGIFDRKRKILLPFTSDYVFLSKVAVNYNENVTEPQFDDWNFSDWLQELSDGDPEKLDLIWRIIYSCINANYISGKVIFFISTQGKSGKGTLQMLLRALVGRRNTVAVRLRQLEERWGVFNAYGKTLIIGDDNSPKDFIERNENLKSIATGDIVQAEGKGKDSFSTVITAQIVQSLNGFPKINSFDDGFKHRLILVPFTHSYQGKENTRIKTEYIYNQQLLEWIAYKALHLSEVELFNSKDGKILLKEFEEENNNVLRFYNEFFNEFTSERIPIKFLFKFYQAWNEDENNPNRMKQNTFTKEIQEVSRPDGWLYSRNSLATLGLFYDEDLHKIERFPLTEYYDHNPKKQQPLLYKDTKK